jgi:hypothetical protein
MGQSAMRTAAPGLAYGLAAASFFGSQTKDRQQDPL